MAIFKKRRQHRYELLREDGFLPTEARNLSQIPLKNPGIKLARKQRRVFLEKVKKEAARKDWSNTKFQQKYVERVRNAYKKNHWYDLKGEFSPFAMFRDSERQAPQPRGYKSPWRKRRHDYKKASKGVDMAALLAQKRKYSRYPIDMRGWVAAIDLRIKNTKDEAYKAELRAQRERIITMGE